MKYFMDGILYNLKGLRFSLKVRSLFMLGLTRFVMLLFLTIALLTLSIIYFSSIMNALWAQPESGIIIIGWYVVSIFVGALVMGISMLVAFIISQLLFSIFIMDLMSRITEKRVTGVERKSQPAPWYMVFIFLIKQEIPRAMIPLAISLIIMVIGWLTPLGPIISIILMLIAVTFLAWDNTDLTPARRMHTFRDRFQFLKRNWLFHLGFGLWFLIPFLNIIFISYAPVGATLYYIKQADDQN